MSDEPIRIGISQCLLGAEVRFDGGHKHDRFITGTLGQFFEYVPVCPEVELGLGTPREPVRLVGQVDAPRFVTVRTRIDHTGDMAAFSERRVEALADLELDGYLLKAKSPSCGMERVKVYPEAGGMPDNKGVGLYARALLDRFPNLPVEEEGRLHDPRLRENFIVRVFCHHRWRAVRREPFKLGQLVEFHARHKFVLLAHSERHLRELGRLVAGAKGRDPAEVLAEYERGLFEAMARPASPQCHVNVLQHIAGFVRDHIDDGDREELHDAIEDYRQGLLPLIVPLTLIRHYVTKFDVRYVKDQVYLYPHPKELMLLNHV